MATCAAQLDRLPTCEPSAMYATPAGTVAVENNCCAESKLLVVSNCTCPDTGQVGQPADRQRLPASDDRPARRSTSWPASHASDRVSPSAGSRGLGPFVPEHAALQVAQAPGHAAVIVVRRAPRIAPHQGTRRPAPAARRGQCRLLTVATGGTPATAEPAGSTCTSSRRERRVSRQHRAHEVGPGFEAVELEPPVLIGDGELQGRALGRDGRARSAGAPRSSVTRPSRRPAIDDGGLGDGRPKSRHGGADAPAPTPPA